jgi:hypothetical protein
MCEVEHLQAIVDKLPKTKDGVPVVPCPTTRLWYIHPGSRLVYERTYEADLEDARTHHSGEDVAWLGVRDCYSTREAAQAAKEE